MRYLRRFLIGIIVVGLPFALAACGSSSSSSSSSSGTSSTATEAAQTSSSGQPKIAGSIFEISGPLTSVWFGAERTGGQAAATAAGVGYEYVQSDPSSGPAMAQSIATAIANHPAGIITHDWYPSAMDPELKKAEAMGIPVVIVDAAGDWQSLGALNYIGVNDYSTAYTAAKMLVADHVKNCIFVNHAPGAANLEQRWLAFNAVMKPAGIKLTQLNIPYSDSTNADAVTGDIRGALASDSSADCVFTNYSTIATDAVSAIDSAGKSSQITLATTDLSVQDLQDIISGKILFATDTQPYLMGYLGVTTIANYARYGMHPAGVIATGPTFVTKANATQILKIDNQYHGIRGA
jgi:simple sugar transport system substrate-binding protein